MAPRRPGRHPRSASKGPEWPRGVRRHSGKVKQPHPPAERLFQLTLEARERLTASGTCLRLGRTYTGKPRDKPDVSVPVHDVRTFPSAGPRPGSGTDRPAVFCPQTAFAAGDRGHQTGEAGTQVGCIFTQPLGDLRPGRLRVWGPGTDAKVQCTRSRAHGLEEKPCRDGVTTRRWLGAGRPRTERSPGKTADNDRLFRPQAALSNGRLQVLGSRLLLPSLGGPDGSLT